MSSSLSPTFAERNNFNAVPSPTAELNFVVSAKQGVQSTRFTKKSSFKVGDWSDGAIVGIVFGFLAGVALITGVIVLVI